MMMMKKAISGLLLVSSSLNVCFVSGAESSVRGVSKDELAAVASEIEEFDLEAALRDIDARAKELEGTEPPKIADLLKNVTLDDDDNDEEQRDRDLQWAVQRNPSIAEIAAAEPSVAVLYSLVDYCGLGPTFSERHSYFTVFAPRNHAFTLIDETVANQLIQSREICNILLYHTLYGALMTNSRDWRFGGPWLTLHGTTLTTETVVTRRGRRINIINGYSRVHQGNIRASNGIIHIIRQVLTPYPLPDPPATTPPAVTTPPGVTTPPATTAAPTTAP